MIENEKWGCDQWSILRRVSVIVYVYIRHHVEIEEIYLHSDLSDISTIPLISLQEEIQSLYTSNHRAFHFHSEINEQMNYLLKCIFLK